MNCAQLETVIDIAQCCIMLDSSESTSKNVMFRKISESSFVILLCCVIHMLLFSSNCECICQVSCLSTIVSVLFVNMCSKLKCAW